MDLFYIEHIPTKRFYSPNTNGQFRAGRNWRRSKAVFYNDLNEAENELDTLVDMHRSGEQQLRIRNFGGFDATRWEDSVGDGYIRERDFRIVQL